MSAPTHRVATYTNDVSSGRYLKDPTIVPFTKVPEWLKVGHTRDNGRKAVGAEMMIDGPTRNKVRTLHTGLIPTGVEHWYVGDHSDIYAGRVCRNTVVFHFTPDARRLILFYFTGLEKYSIPERVKFARQVIPWLRVPGAIHATTEHGNGGQ